MNTVLSNSIDNQTKKTLYNHCKIKKNEGKTQKATKTDCFPYLYGTRSNKTLGLIKIQIEVQGSCVQNH